VAAIVAHVRSQREWPSTTRASAKRELDRPHPTLAPADHDHPQKTRVNQLGEAERTLDLRSTWSPSAPSEVRRQTKTPWQQNKPEFGPAYQFASDAASGRENWTAMSRT